MSDLPRARRRGAPIGQVDDLALIEALDRGVRLLDEALQPFRQPMIAARLPAIAVHALLHHDPTPVVGDDEAVQIKIEAILHRGAVHLGDEPARLASAAPSKPTRSPIAMSSCGRLPRMLAAAAADMDAEFAASGARPRFSAPITLVVMPEECQSIPITAPKD